MPFNGAGTFNRLYSWVTDAANGIFVSSTRTDADTNDIASGLTNCVTKDGQSTPTANLPMGGFKLTNLGLGSASTDSARVDNANSQVNEFRLTLTSGSPVTTANVAAATTIYCTPYKGNHIALYDGTNWHMRNSAEFSLALGTLTSGKPYDVFCYDNAGVPTLEFLVWTSDTARATALAYQDGVLVKSGATTRRYMGTFYTTSTTQTADSAANRYLWNYNNRVSRHMTTTLAANTWTYTTATIRQANASSNNQLNFIVGVSEDAVQAWLTVSAANTSAGVTFAAGFGLDSTSTFTGINNSTNSASVGVATTQVVNTQTPTTASFCGAVAEGRHFLSWNEYSTATGTTTWSTTAAASAAPCVLGVIRG